MADIAHPLIRAEADLKLAEDALAAQVALAFPVGMAVWIRYGDRTHNGKTEGVILAHAPHGDSAKCRKVLISRPGSNFSKDRKPKQAWHSYLDLWPQAGHIRRDTLPLHITH
jgi:hypothetical protein